MDKHRTNVDEVVLFLVRAKWALRNEDFTKALEHVREAEDALDTTIHELIDEHPEVKRG